MPWPTTIWTEQDFASMYRVTTRWVDGHRVTEYFPMTATRSQRALRTRIWRDKPKPFWRLSAGQWWRWSPKQLPNGETGWDVTPGPKVPLVH